MTYLIVLALSAFLISLLGTRLTILALRRRNLLLDRPNERSNHIAPTPRGGGIAVVFALIMCLMQADISYAVIFSMLLLAAISLLDDLMDVPPLVRLIVQALAVAVPLSTMHHPLFHFLPLWANMLFIGLAWIWFINLFNFMDGIDGIAASEMIGIGAGLCLVAAFAGHFPSAISVYGMILAVTACGFLWWNWHPAKIFLGDVGSVPIGFLCFYLLLLAASAGYGAAALILPAYYLCDSTITLLKRAYKRKKIWAAHSEHYYQKAVRSGRKHDTVVRYVIGINILLMMLAVFATIEPELAMINIAMAYTAVFMLLGFFAHAPHDPENEPL